MTNSPALVDFHCHLDLYPDLADAISICDDRRVATLAVTTTPKAFFRHQELAARSSFVRVGLGLHPQLVEDRADEIALFEKLVVETRYVGEVGLDAGPRFYRSLALQQDVLRRVLRACASEGDKILSLHSVRSARLVLDLLEAEFPTGRGTAIMHWFTGSVSEMRRGLRLGCFFSVNEGMARSESGRRLISELPFDRVLTETDGPFLTRGDKPISPGDVDKVLELLSMAYGVSVEAVRSQVLVNLRKIENSKSR